MLDIKLPDGKSISFQSKVNGFIISEKISKSLAKQALIMSVDGELKDLDFSIDKNASYASKYLLLLINSIASVFFLLNVLAKVLVAIMKKSTKNSVFLNIILFNY